MRVLLIFVATLLLAFRCVAESLPEPSTYVGNPDPELVLQWLHAPDPRLQAWAAHDILVFHLTDLTPELQSLLERTTPATLSEAARIANSRTTLGILDSLIQLGAEVPADTLLRIEKLGYDVQIEELVLLSRLPWGEAEPVVYSLYNASPTSRSDIFRVAAQVLAQHPPKGFAAEVLSTIVVSGNISVHDANSGLGLAVGSGSSSCCGAGSSSATDWPEIGRYSFQDPPTNQKALPENETLFLSGPDPIYLFRSVGRTYSAATCGGIRPLNDAIRSHLVGTMLGGDPVSPFPEKPLALDILFKSRESYRAEVQAFVDHQLQNFNEVAAGLAARNVLSEEERQAAELRLDLSLQDLRMEPAEDLPHVAFRPPIRWVSEF